MKYRVIAGSHSHSEFESGTKKGKPRIYRQGMVFEHTNPRLHLLHKNKFEPMPEDAEVTPEWLVELDLDRMTTEQLLDYAVLNNIFIPSSAGPRDVLTLVKQELEKREHEKREAPKKPVGK